MDVWPVCCGDNEDWRVSEHRASIYSSELQVSLIKLTTLRVNLLRSDRTASSGGRASQINICIYMISINKCSVLLIKIKN